MEVHDHVTIKGTKNPVGIIEHLIGSTIAVVRWGSADNHTYVENVAQSKLEVVTEKILSPEEVEHRNIFE
jgi:hypothetical protein